MTQLGGETKSPLPQNNVNHAHGQQPQMSYTGFPTEESRYTGQPNAYQYPVDNSTHELSSSQARQISELATYLDSR